jgi:hypothetical protein
LKLYQMNVLGESVPSTEIRKKKRGSRFRYSSKKVLERSRLSKKTAKACGSEFTTTAKALVFSSVLSSQTDHPDCATSSGGQPLLQSVLELGVQQLMILFSIHHTLERMLTLYLYVK